MKMPSSRESVGTFVEMLFHNRAQSSFLVNADAEPIDFESGRLGTSP